MGFPYQSITAAALGIGYLFSSNRIPQLPATGFLAAFAAAWALQSFAWIAYVWILYPKVFSPLRHFPGPTDDSFFMGQYEKIHKLPTGLPMLQWMNSIPNDGVLRYLGPLNQERLLITSPKTLGEVLTTKSYDFKKPDSLRYAVGRILGIGILFAEGGEHKAQRRKLMPAFAYRHVKDLYPVFWNKSREGVQVMTDTILADSAKEAELTRSELGLETGVKKNTSVIEVGHWASRATLDIIGIAGLGRDFGAIKEPDNELSRTYTHLFKPNRQAQILGLLGLFIPGWLLDMLPVKRNEDIHGAAKLIRATCADLIREKKQKLANKEVRDVDILSVALESGAFTDENLIDQMMTFLLAGHETTASAMTWAVYLLAKHQDMQTRLREEIRAHLPALGDGDDGETVSSTDLDGLPYLDAFCNEVLRYLPPVPMLLREAACDTTIQGHPVPKGTRIMIPTWGINKSLDMWGPTALQFDPNRWLAGADGDKKAAGGGATSNYAFSTFLHGPRSCIGQQFAKAEFACLLATWAGRFAFELNDLEEMDEEKIEIKGGITARPAKGMYVKATVVEGW